MVNYFHRSCLRGTYLIIQGTMTIAYRGRKINSVPMWTWEFVDLYSLFYCLLVSLDYWSVGEVMQLYRQAIKSLEILQNVFFCLLPVSESTQVEGTSGAVVYNGCSKKKMTKESVCDCYLFRNASFWQPLRVSCSFCWIYI